MRLQLVRRQSETHDVETFYWKPADPAETKPEFKPGQFLKWSVLDDHPDDRGNDRWFTISASPTEPELHNSTKFNPEGSTFKKTLAAMSPGDEINIVGPMGSFVLPDDPNQPLVFVAGGIGVTPFRSMLKYMVDTNMTTPVHLLYACRSDQDIAFKDEFESWAQSHPNIKITYLLGTPSQTVASETGQLSAERIIELAGGAEGKLFYLSGPEAMVESIEEKLKPLVGEEHLKTDYFPNYTEV